MVAWPEGTSKRLQAGKGTVALQKLPLQISKAGCSFQLSSVSPTQLLATTKGRLASTSENRRPPLFRMWVLFLSMKHYVFPPWKWTESTSHHGRLRGKCRLEETFARVKMEHGKERKHHFRPSFLDYTDFLYYGIVDLQCTLVLGVQQVVSYTYILFLKFFPI